MVLTPGDGGHRRAEPALRGGVGLHVHGIHAPRVPRPAAARDRHGPGHDGAQPRGLPRAGELRGVQQLQLAEVVLSDGLRQGRHDRGAQDGTALLHPRRTRMPAVRVGAGGGARMNATLLAASLLAAATPVPRADLLLLNGHVYTVDSARPWAEAVAIAGDRIVAVGSTAELRRMAGPQTRVVDLHGSFVVPGFNDAHVHIDSTGALLTGANLL